MISANYFLKNKNQVLFALQAAILFIYSLALSLSNTLIYHNFNSGFLWKHWIGYGTWFITVFLLNKLIEKRQNNPESFIFPLATMLTGIGIMTIWRLSGDFGFRQSIIFGFIGLFLAWLLSDDNNIQLFTKNYYLFLGAGLVLSLVTILFGTNPSGFGPKLWLGCCGVYLQPSEPLKLIFIVLLSVFLPRQNGKKSTAWFLIFILLLIFSILLTQRDLGTSSIFIILLSGLLYIHIKSLKILVGSLLVLIFSGFLAFYLIDLVQQRVMTWINPWQDPTDSSYQIIQALITIANGGINGRGPGIGYPSLVPIAHSDFIFTSITEELGVLGSIAVIIMFAFLTFEGFLISKRLSDPVQKLLAAGISIYLSAQSIVIIGGNVKLLPLTGVTLPFLSYGGSSLFTSYLAIITLYLLNEQTSKDRSINNSSSKELSVVLGGSLVGFILCAGALGWWGIYQSDILLNRTDNPRRSISDYYVHRGSILDRSNSPLTVTEGSPGSYSRRYLHPELSPILGYTDPVFGQVSIERSFDATLRGQKGYSDLILWWSHIIYGRSPTGLNIRTTIDTTFQEKLSAVFEQKEGSALVINSSTGEILAGISSPYIDANNLEDLANQKTQANAPLINRLSQGEYPVILIEPVFDRLVTAQNGQSVKLLPEDLLIETRFFEEPDLGFELKNKTEEIDQYVSPIQTAKLLGSISNNGVCPGLKFVSAVQSPDKNWVILPDPDKNVDCFSLNTVNEFGQYYLRASRILWSYSNYDPASQTMMYVAGTVPDWTGIPLTLVVFEENSYRNSFQLEWDDFFETFILQD